VNNLCVVCRHRQPDNSHVCELDQARIQEQLAELPTLVGELALQLIPAAGVAAELRAPANRSASPASARLDALTLLGPGSRALSDVAAAAMMHPAVRRWRTTSQVTVHRDTPAGPVTWDTDVATWHQEAVVDDHGTPVMVAADDQVGIMPPAEWLDGWARTWRTHLGHTRYPVRPGGGLAARLAGPAARRYAIEVVLGMAPGYSGAPTLTPDDPLGEEWEIRWGTPSPTGSVQADAAYLAESLSTACTYDLDIAAFAAELRTLTAELVRVLGRRPAVQWLGRCPTRLIDRVTDRSRVCGAGLWQDPHAPQAMCGRCHATWGPGKTALLYLAKAIRQVWPVDRRSRYTADEIDTLRRVGTLRRLRCPACTEPVDIDWRETTAVGDSHRTWRPARAMCPAGCPDAGRLI
jgi:hypothetical protein